jgi:hypothetical protein
MPEEFSQENMDSAADKANSEVTNFIDQNLESQEKKENMEIYHPHGKHHERKLKDYFYEFFMLFLAVTAGFFMENLRETYIERHKENQYVLSLMRDVQQDTTDISGVIQTNRTQVKGIDSLLILLGKSISEMDLDRLYYLTNQYLSNLNGFSVREITITQLRNSGGLRLIDNKLVSDSIVDYYGTFESHMEQQKYEFKLLQEMLDMKMKILDYRAYRDTSIKKTFEASQVKEFYNRILVFRSMLKYEADWLDTYHKKGISLLKFLKEEYKID